MNHPQHKVLVDMSPASLRYCGIAQASRLLLKTLYRTDGIQPAGLIFGHDDAVVAHRFSSSSRVDRRMENQALFLQSLIDHSPQCSRLAPARWLQRGRSFWRLFLARRVHTDSLDCAVFWDAIWRGLLVQSLPEPDIDIAHECPMLLADLGGRMLTARALLRLPAPRLDTAGYGFVVYHGSRAIQADPRTCKLIKYYDMIPGVRPDLVGSHADIANHFRAIRRCLGDSIYVCSSGPTRDDLVRAFPELEQRSVVIPEVVADGYYPERIPELLPAIIASRRAPARSGAALRNGFLNQQREMPPYLLMTAAIEPRKNHITLIRAFEKMLARRRTDLRLIVVGELGWKYDETVRIMKPLIAQQRLLHLAGVPLSEMRALVSQAEAIVFPSLYEGFGYAPLEAMSCHTPAVVSDIPAHRWTYGDAALYFDPYRIDSLVEALERLLFADSGGLRARLVEAGIECVKRYSPAAVGAKFLALFDELKRQGIGRNVKDARLGAFA